MSRKVVVMIILEQIFLCQDGVRDSGVDIRYSIFGIEEAENRNGRPSGQFSAGSAPYGSASRRPSPSRFALHSKVKVDPV